MIAIIRISGMVDRTKKVDQTLDRLRLRRKYACVLVPNTEENKGMLKIVKDHVAYGHISEETLVKLIEKRGQLLDKKGKIDSKKISEQILKDKNFKETGIKPFFRLHPPRGGINSKQHFPKGVLGNHKDHINKLIERML